MPFPDSDNSSRGGAYKSFRQISRDLVEDLYRRRQPLPSMDAIYFIQPSKEKYGYRSHHHVFVRHVRKRTFIQENVISWFSCGHRAYVYFSSPVSKDLVTHIKNDVSVRPRIGALREMNLEYFAIDNQGFITDHERALEQLFGDVSENPRRFDACLNIMATRIATVFASLKEFPLVRYRAAKGLDSDTITTFRDLVPTKLAAAVWNNITTYKSSTPNFPQEETCELLIVDRSIDQIAPIIHEWTYDAMCHDLLNLDGNKYVHEVPSKSGGKPERKEVLLEDHDLVWLELRHTHIAEASERLHEKMKKFVSKNKAAQLQQRLIAPIIHEWTYDAMCHDLLNLDGNKYVHEVPSKSGGKPERKEVLLEDHDLVWLELRHTHIAEASERLHEKMKKFVSKNKAAQLQQRDGSDLSTRDLQKMVQALPQYSEQMEKLSLHVEIAGKLNKMIRDMGLRELGQLEQDLVFGDAGPNEVINFLRAKQELTNENKLRLMMIYAAVYPENFEGDKALKVIQLAKLPGSDMKAVINMKLIEGSDTRKASKGTFSLKFDSEKRKHATRKDRSGEEETWALSRFYPMIEAPEGFAARCASRPFSTMESVFGWNITWLTLSSWVRYRSKQLAHPVGDADPDFGSCQAKELLDHLENVLANEPAVVWRGQHIVEVKQQVCSLSLLQKALRLGAPLAFFNYGKELIEKLSKGELPKDEYHCMNNPSPSSRGTEGTRDGSRAASVRAGRCNVPHSMRSRRTAAWARPRASDDENSDSVMRTASSDLKKMGQRIFVFIIGGATRSELRACHKLTAKLRREVVLGTTSIDDPPQYLTKLKLLSENELLIDDIRI
ncbi:snare-interacting protein keule [Phtheirospermum japonicum]|uniref:Snare-interacting protein keule n=1 Tax=Phtheirospermum japonicum TaxID=374723 RepID=A0A830C9W7_9LAMI|nr:snare-interacting protein keule [Phtheirospermum japonicum]